MSVLNSNRIDSDALVTIVEHDTEEYLLLNPTPCPPRTGPNYNVFASYQDVDQLINALDQSTVVALDFETKGGDYSDDIQIIGVGLAWDTGSCYYNWADIRGGYRQRLIDCLLNHPSLIAHNIYFDGGVALKHWGKHANWLCDTYSTYSFLANEGIEGRFWGLKAAQVELLCWASSNETELDRWLVTNGYYRGNKRLDSSYEYLNAEYESGGLKPDKGEMWRAPIDILGKYCILDAESTYLLYTRILSPVLGQFSGLADFLSGPWMNHILRHIEQKMYGILMDRPGLLSYKQQLELDIDRLTSEFMNHDETIKHIRIIEREWYEEEASKPAPPQFKKDGGISKNYLNRQKRLQDIEQGLNPDYRFNINSAVQLRDLIYNRMGKPVRIETEKGEASTAAKALRSLGGVFNILVQRADHVKELTYIDKYLELTEKRLTIHPSFRTPGTTTGRLSSKEPNLQQVPKTRAVMSLFKARPGTVWVDLDFSALEPVVATEFSRDPNMALIYGDNRPANDIYIFVMAHIPGMRERTQALGYDPRNPTKESLARVKKEMKHERSICKTVVLACQYGAGVRKVHQTLEEQEVFLSYEEVETIHSGYWHLFAKLKDYGNSLMYEWKRNRGYILNGVGRPMAVSEDYTKDLLNRFVQSTGHDILVTYVHILTQLLDEEYIPWTPLIIDFHDATTVEVPEEYGQQTLQLFNKAMDILNDMLQGTIRLRGVPVIGRDLAEVKEPEQ